MGSMVSILKEGLCPPLLRMSDSSPMARKGREGWGHRSSGRALA
jgi:hypothetical protein